MTSITKDKLKIDQGLYDLVENDIIPGTGINAEAFWREFQDIIHEFMPRNKELLEIRDEYQEKIDAETRAPSSF